MLSSIFYLLEMQVFFQVIKDIIVREIVKIENSTITPSSLFSSIVRQIVDNVIQRLTDDNDDHAIFLKMVKIVSDFWVPFMAETDRNTL
jgi:hypothetical protein